MKKSQKKRKRKKLKKLQWIMPVIFIIGYIVYLLSSCCNKIVGDLLVAFAAASAYALLAQMLPVFLKNKSDKNQFCEYLSDFHAELDKNTFPMDLYGIMDEHMTRLEFCIICFDFTDGKEMDLFLDLDRIKNEIKDLTLQQQIIADDKRRKGLQIISGYLSKNSKNRKYHKKVIK